MKKIIVIAIMILGIVSCKSKGDEPTPVIISSTGNSYMDQLEGTWVLSDIGDLQGSYYGRTIPYYDANMNKAAYIYRDSTVSYDFDYTTPSTVSWTAMYYIDANHYYWQKLQSLTYTRGLKYNIQGNVLIGTNDDGTWQKYIKQ